MNITPDNWGARVLNPLLVSHAEKSNWLETQERHIDFQEFIRCKINNYEEVVLKSLIKKRFDNHVGEFLFQKSCIQNLKERMEILSSTVGPDITALNIIFAYEQPPFTGPSIKQFFKKNWQYTIDKETNRALTFVEEALNAYLKLPNFNTFRTIEFLVLADADLGQSNSSINPWEMVNTQKKLFCNDFDPEAEKLSQLFSCYEPTKKPEVIGLNRRLEDPAHPYNQRQQEWLVQRTNQESGRDTTYPLNFTEDEAAFYSCLPSINETKEFLFQKGSPANRTLVLNRVIEIRKTLFLITTHVIQDLILDYDIFFIKTPDIQNFLNKRVVRFSNDRNSFLTFSLSNYKQKPNSERFQVVEEMIKQGVDVNEPDEFEENSILENIRVNIQDYDTPFDRDGSKLLKLIESGNNPIKVRNNRIKVRNKKIRIRKKDYIFRVFLICTFSTVFFTLLKVILPKQLYGK